MVKNQFEMIVCVNGRPIREYGHRGLTFVEGRQKHPYTLKFRNNSANRVLALFCVDGLSVVDGKPADNESRGYIVPAYGTIEVKGWRTSLEEVHDFVFDSTKRAVSTQAEKTDANCGIIEVKVFDEKINCPKLPQWLQAVEHHHHHHYERHNIDVFPYRPPVIWCGNTTGEPVSNIMYGASTNNASTNNASTNNASSSLADLERKKSVGSYTCSTTKQENPDFNLGTAWGKVQADKVDEQKFDRGAELACFAVYYSDATGLKAAGIEVDKKPMVSKSVLPKGFNGFCKPPVITS